MISIFLLIIIARTAYAQDIFDGSKFICDPLDHLDCKYGDNIICDVDSICTVACNEHCNGLIINANFAKSLSITNCINCDNMIIKCPLNQLQMDNNCNLEIANNINNVIIYAQESFHDFNLIQSPYNDKTYNAYSSSMHCGDLTKVEFQCTLNYYGNACTDTDSICQNYRIPTTTISPTITTSAPTSSPSTQTVDGNDLPTNLETTSTTTADDGDLYVVGEVVDEDDVVSNNDNGHSNDGTLGLFTGTRGQNMTYALLIIGLCIIWGSFFCCFIITHYHRDKKRQQLDRAVTIMARAMSPTLAHTHTPRRFFKVDVDGAQDMECQLPPKKPYLDGKFSLDSELAKKMKIIPPSITEAEIRELQKVASLPIMAGDDKKQDDEPIVCDVIPTSPNGIQLRSVQLRAHQLRPYFCDKLSPEAPQNKKSNKNRNVPALDPENQLSNPVSINTINTVEAVKIKLPSFGDKDAEKLKISNNHLQIEQKHKNDEEGTSVSIKDELKMEDIQEEEEEDEVYAEEVYEEEEEEEEEEEKDDLDIPLDLQYQFHLHLQAEGGDTTYNLSSVMCSDYSAEVPPPPPPSLVHDTPKHEVHKALHGVHTLSKCGGMMDNKEEDKIQNQPPQIQIASPSQHYRVKYSLGMQQDIQNCMNAPGDVISIAEHFQFDEELGHRLKTESMSTSHYVLTPPAVPVDHDSNNKPKIMYNN